MKQLLKKDIKKLFKKIQKREQEIVLLLENIEYAKNVAGIFRTADAAGVNHLYLTGESYKPPFGKDLKKASRGKETSVKWSYFKDSEEIISQLKKDNYFIIAIELTDESIQLHELKNLINKYNKVCFIAGSEAFGITKKTLAYCDAAVMIPMYGKGASLNVGVSVGVVLYSI